MFLWFLELDFAGGFDTHWDGHHDDEVVGRGGQFPLSENALSGQKMYQMGNIS